MKTILTVLLVALCSEFVSAQCNSFFPIRENVKYTYEFFDKKEKLSSRTRQWLKDVSGAGNSMKAVMVQEMIDPKKDKLIATSESDWSCDDGTLHFYINNITMDGMNTGTGMTADITGDKMDIPSTLYVGQALRDITYNIKMAMSGVTMMNKSINVKDRKVEAEEKVVTPAGTFDAFRVSFTTLTDGFGGGTTKSIVWYTKDVGLVKSENYSAKGDLLSRQLLTKIEK